MKIYLSAILTLFICLSTFGQKLDIPEGYTIVDTVSGDLDKDGIKELVAAYNTATLNPDTDGFKRELIIYKKDKSVWKVWKKSQRVLFGSQDGGMMGDPFGEMEIKNGCLFISQNGGSSWKWGHTDQYRYQDGEFVLIGYKSDYGKICEVWTSVDFNLSTGKMIVEKEYQSCSDDDEEQKVTKRENETLFQKGLKITLQDRNTKEIKFTSPRYKHEIYVSIKLE